MYFFPFFFPFVFNFHSCFTTSLEGDLALRRSRGRSMIASGERYGKLVGYGVLLEIGLVSFVSLFFPFLFLYILIGIGLGWLFSLLN